MHLWITFAGKNIKQIMGFNKLRVKQRVQETNEAVSIIFDQLEDDELGGILAVPAKDTLKIESADTLPKVDKTLDRSTVWQAQTPQMFRYKLLIDALSSAIAHNTDITDEASALEAAGYKPRLIEGEARNLKITTPEDIELAEFLLKK